MKKAIFLLCLLLLSNLELNGQERFPTITVADQDGNRFILHEVLDSERNYLIETYADWCGWCKKELKEWKECKEDWLQDYNIEVLVLSTDGIDKPDSTLHFFNTEGLDYTVYFTEPDSAATILDLFAYPTNFIINAEGEILDRKEGYESCEDMSKILSETFTQDPFEAKIIRTASGIHVSTNTLEEAIDIKIFSLEGALHKTIENAQTNTDILVGIENMDIVIIQVLGERWMRSKMILLR